MFDLSMTNDILTMQLQGHQCAINIVEQQIRTDSVDQMDLSIQAKSNESLNFYITPTFNTAIGSDAIGTSECAGLK